ncbi:MAG: DUF2238 domain-containing protein [Peptostreptococcaceae bacterium]
MNSKKVNFIIGFIYVLYIISGLWYIKEKMLFELSIVAFCIIGTFALGILNKKISKLVDDSIYINLVLFIMISSLIGSCFGFYDINHYDDFLHLYSGILCCNVAYLIIRYFNNKDNMNKLFVVIFLFMFTMGVASLWEIMEFAMDNILGTNTQVGGLKDTVIDMIDALLGAIISIPYFVKKFYKAKAD